MPPTLSASPTASGSSAGATPSTSAPVGDLGAFAAQKLVWKGCGDHFECTTLQVPLDYAHPEGAQLGIKVNRLPASDEKKRLGSLVVNPGGPGASGLSYARDARSVVTAKVRARYDIVGFDPRGVASSAPVHCLDAAATDKIIAADGSPDTPAEEQELVTLSKGLAAGCEAKSAAELPFLGTRDAARDLDLLRAALGDDKLTYLGKSYGTFLGASYAEQFPTRVGHLVLDGALDPSSTTDEVNAGQAAGFEQALGSFVENCLKTKGCPLSGDKAAALRRIDAFLAQLDAKPLPAAKGRPLTQALGLLGIAVSLYDNSFWPYLRLGLTDAFKGDGAVLLTLADTYTDRNDDGTYADNSNDAIYAVNCLDRPDTSTPDALRAQAAGLAKVSPRFGAYLAWSSLPCASWPVPPTGTPHRVTAHGAAPILVVGTTRDPATPYVWAESLASQLESGHLLSWNGDGHTAYQRGSTCIDNAVDAYLIDGTLPADGTLCR